MRTSQAHITSAHWKRTVQAHSTCAQYKRTAQAHSTSAQYKHTSQAHSTSAQYKRTSQAHITSSHHKRTLEAHSTCAHFKRTAHAQDCSSTPHDGSGLCTRAKHVCVDVPDFLIALLACITGIAAFLTPLKYFPPYFVVDRFLIVFFPLSTFYLTNRVARPVSSALLANN